MFTFRSIQSAFGNEEGAWQRLKRWPSLCMVCHAWPSQPLCEACVAQFAQPRRRCPTCALPCEQVICPTCPHTPAALDHCLCAVDYGYPWADCVARFKFQANPSLGRALAHLMRHAPWVEPALEQADSLIPMPLSIQRLSERGFNQAQELARHLDERKADPYTLLRIELGRHQVGQSRTERLTNVLGSFWVAPDRMIQVRDKRVVLVDDVMTTGATMFEAARALRRAGAAHITGLVFARTAQSA